MACGVWYTCVRASCVACGACGVWSVECGIPVCVRAVLRVVRVVCGVWSVVRVWRVVCGVWYTCVRASCVVKRAELGRDLRKLLSWKATTGRG